MRHGRAVLLGLVVGLLAGCTAEGPIRTTAWLQRFHPLQGPAGPDVIQIQVALVERPLGDAYLNQELWDLADEQGLPFERKGVLEANGFRVGIVAGNTPPGLLALLTTERSCANPRSLQVRTGSSPAPLVLGPVLAQCRFRLTQPDGQLVEVQLEQAQCKLTLTPTLTKDGKTRLQFAPQVQHGETKLVTRPTADRSNWQLLPQQPAEVYSGLGCEIILAPNEYVIMGTRLDRPETLGYQAFVRVEEQKAVQRLLVIRTSRTQPSVAGDGNSGLVGSAPPGAPPLALQAAYTAVRGSDR